MNTDPGSLDNLRDIVVPPPVPWWPPAAGWWVVFSVLIIILVVLTFYAWHLWRLNAYRRAALKELRSAPGIAAIAEILKRTALCAYPRTEVASLSGDGWCRWLSDRGGRQIPADVAKALTLGVFAERDECDMNRVVAFAADWIKQHRGERDSSGVGKNSDAQHRSRTGTRSTNDEQKTASSLP